MNYYFSMLIASLLVGCGGSLGGEGLPEITDDGGQFSPSSSTEPSTGLEASADEPASVDSGSNTPTDAAVDTLTTVDAFVGETGDQEFSVAAVPDAFNGENTVDGHGSDSSSCTLTQHHDTAGDMWFACYALETYSAAAATDACNAYFNAYYPPSMHSTCTPNECTGDAGVVSRSVCAWLLDADGGDYIQTCWIYSGPGSVGTTQGPGGECDVFAANMPLGASAACGTVCRSSSRWW